MEGRSGFHTGIVIGFLSAAVVALGVVVVVIATGDDEEGTPATTATTQTTTTESEERVSCGRLAGPLGDNVFGIEATGVTCDEAQQTTQLWLDENCGAKPPGTSCALSTGYSCGLEESGVEGAIITCTREDQTVKFETGA